MSNEPKWHEIGDKLSRKYVYLVPISPETRIVERLGMIWQRADGSWNWWRYSSNSHKWVLGQGVSPNKEQAMTKVLKGWD